MSLVISKIILLLLFLDVNNTYLRPKLLINFIQAKFVGHNINENKLKWAAMEAGLKARGANIAKNHRQ